MHYRAHHSLQAQRRAACYRIAHRSSTECPRASTAEREIMLDANFASRWLSESCSLELSRNSRYTAVARRSLDPAFGGG
jgi:hypothetical protein